MTRSRRSLSAALGALVVLAAALTPVALLPVAAQDGGWSNPTNISRSAIRSWFPDIKVDVTGMVHVVWCETERKRDGHEAESIHYARWDGYYWSEPRSIVAQQADIRRNALAIGAGELLMVYNQTSMAHMGLVLSAAPLDQAWLAPAWSEARTVNAFGGTYYADMDVDARGVVHLLFDDWGFDPEERSMGGFADIYYRRSTDNGRSWSVPANLSSSTYGSSRGQLKIDAAGGLHATWDEGWDRLSGMGEAHHSVYRYSGDGGNTWSPPVTVSSPVTGTEQLVSAADGRGGVLLVWRMRRSDEIYYRWSQDGGAEWSRAEPIPGVWSREWGIPFDLYDTAVDSGGNMHLLLVARAEPAFGVSLQVYHLVWDGAAWSTPTIVWQGSGYPEYPRLAISEGNHLHAVWFVRDDLWIGKTYNVWYSDLVVPAPRQTPAPTLTPIPSPTATPTATPFPSPTPYPTLIATGHRDLQDDLTSASELPAVMRLGLALAPVAALLVIAVVVRRLWRRV